MEPLTPLQSKLVSMIVSHARLSGWEPGHHLTEESLLPVLATSRSPIRKAMAWLAAKGVLERRPNKGFFLRSLPPSDSKTLKSEIEPEGDKIYAAIAMDRLARRLPDVVSENELIRRYGVSRAQLRLALARMAAEGWIERRPGRGWEFQPLIDTVEAYRENYRFRQIVEPSAMRTPEPEIVPRVNTSTAVSRSILNSASVSLSTRRARTALCTSSAVGVVAALGTIAAPFAPGTGTNTSSPFRGRGRGGDPDEPPAHAAAGED